MDRLMKKKLRDKRENETNQFKKKDNKRRGDVGENMPGWYTAQMGQGDVCVQF
jgi:hypothetical protein